jgi:Tfp pilus assembly protein PilF
MPLPKPGQRAYSANTAKSTPTPLWILGAGSIILILLAGYILYRNFSTQKTNEINATPMPGNYELGMNALNQGDYPQAILNFTEAINAEPQNAAAYYKT